MKLNKILFIGAMAISVITPLWQSCEKFALEDEAESGKTSDQVQITFKLLTPSTSRATAATDFKTVVVLDEVNGKTKQMVRQDAQTSPDFGSPTISLTQGTHQLHFFATDADHTELNGETVKQAPLGDSFYKSIEVNTENVSGPQRVILERQVAQVLYLGENEAELNGILENLDLKSGKPIEDGQKSVLSNGQFLYTYIPNQGYLTLKNGTHVPVAKNQITRVDIDGSEGGGEIPNPPTESEILVATTDTALIYVSELEICDVILAEYPNPEVSFAHEMGNYRMPTRREALILNKETLPADYWLGDRCLCYDDPADAGITTDNNAKLGTGKHYTFLWGSGSVTSAGIKTAYSIKPIRSVPLAPIATSYEIDGNFTWNSDTTTVK